MGCLRGSYATPAHVRLALLLLLLRDDGRRRHGRRLHAGQLHLLAEGALAERLVHGRAPVGKAERRRGEHLHAERYVRTRSRTVGRRARAPDEGGHQSSSELIRGNQSQSVAPSEDARARLVRHDTRDALGGREAIELPDERHELCLSLGDERA